MESFMYDCADLFSATMGACQGNDYFQLIMTVPLFIVVVNMCASLVRDGRKGNL